MIDPVNSVMTLIKLLIAFGILYIFIPTRIIKFDEENSSFLDKVFISLVNSNFLIIFLVHLLAFLKAYETFSLLFSVVVIIMLLIWLKLNYILKPPEIFGLKTTSSLYDIADGGIMLVKDKYKKFWHNLWNRAGLLKKQTKDFFLKPFNGILVFVVFAFALYLRFHHALTHLFLGASDSYLHFAWVKYLNKSNIYGAGMTDGGIYSYGFHSIMSAINKLTLIDTYYIIRFIGAIAGFFVVLSIYYVLRKNFKNPFIAWFALLLYIMGSWLPGYGSTLWRQSVALPEIYSLIFFLPGLHYFNIFFKSEKKFYLLLAGECLALSIFIHPYVTFFLSIGYLFIGIVNLRKLIKIKTFLLTLVTMASSILISALPLYIGQLMGIKWQSLNYVKSVVSVSGNSKSKTDIGLFIQNNPYIMVYFIAVFILILIYALAGINKKIRSRVDNIGLGIGLVLLSLAVFLLYLLGELGIFSLIRSFTVQMFFSLLIVIIVPLNFYLIDIFITRERIKNFVKISALIIVTGCVILYYQFQVPQGIIQEYDDAVKAYLDIRSSFTPNTWTIISPVEQYSEVLGYGYHTELIDFVRMISGQEKRKMPAGTDNVFIFVEKIPLYSNQKVSLESANKTFPEISDDVLKYYTEPGNRMILESKAYYWAENYMKTHKDMKIYSDTKYMRVYYLKQNGIKPVALY